MLGLWLIRQCSHLSPWASVSVMLIASFPFLAAAPLRAQEPLSAPLSGSIGDPVYSESAGNGPSTSIIEGGTNLTTPFLRSGISDPLSFLIESGFMSPYVGSTVNSYADAAVYTQAINDSISIGRYSEYRNNRALMAGAGAASLASSRSALTASASMGSSGVRTAGSGSSAFGGLQQRAPFAAGRSGPAASQEGMSGGLIDPGLLAAGAAASFQAMGAMPSADSSASVAATSMPDGFASAGQSGGSGVAGPATASADLMVRPPGSTAIGPEPGSIFPDLSVSTPSGTGFSDSTMGTSSASVDAGMLTFSHLSSSSADPSESPFANRSGEDTRYLSPSLRSPATGGAAPAEPVSFSELARKARLHAMIYNPGAPLPTPFAQRAMERDYQRQLRSHRRVSHYPDTTAPSIKP